MPAGDVVTIAYVADCHLGSFKRFGGTVTAGINERGHDQVAALQRAVHAAIDMNCSAFGILGDVFDYVHVEPQLIAAAQRVLELIASFVMVGNHDQESSAERDNALAPLAPVTSVFEKPALQMVDDVCLWIVPFQPGPPSEWLPGVLKELDEQLMAQQHTDPAAWIHLCLHMGITDSKTPDFLARSSGAIDVDLLFKLMRRHDIDVCLSGDWHRHEVWTQEATTAVGAATIVQVGCLAPTRFPPGSHEDAARGPMVVVDGNEVTVVEIPGPRFLKARWGEGLAYEKHELDTVYAKVSCLPQDKEEAIEWLEGLKSSGEIKNFVVDVDSGDSRVQVQDAQARASAAENVDAAIEEFVGAMPLDEGVDRQRVLTLTRGYFTR